MKRSNDTAAPGTTISTPRRTRGRPACSDAGGAEALLRSARAAFAKSGYEATSVREIARLSGVDPALVAHHFGSKEALWVAVVGQIADEAAPMIASTAALRATPGLGPRERVEAAVSLLIDQVFLTPDVGMFFSTAATETGERLDVLIERLVRPFHDVFVPLLVDAIDAGQVPRQDPEIMFLLLANGISKTVAYSHALSPFSALPRRPKEFKRAVLTSALAALG
ncbi:MULTISPECIES: TetR/AcrR family transcriptional regulator [Burkholderia]|uniref:TetR family transcriptional regulator n=1 Tax=Burkholderia savannae TaxID=1637837 RepID=A0ABR5T3V8_9BURK|nr:MULTISPECIES: TetR/AcrR family transcriptional regulator [Burkholderia]AOJ84546.1 TetR family transcriptional regulator [Burkholderia savannae]KGS00083.1 bacterial regulatory s, tetR family protein [Burkholderia sp. ABCPW 111]KVK91047.1 TetR family transcriptional regulator [Burkholderia sp. MSMB1498]KWZ37515.1 TetR family transcriptional regulator [Burkholderia savannae]KWZ48455.1 TetR family transcriptional regulator [Burkholderia savannae]